MLRRAIGGIVEVVTEARNILADALIVHPTIAVGSQMVERRLLGQSEELDCKGERNIVGT